MNKLLKILKNDYETIPFHNFRLLLNEDMPLVYGGTCSDKTVYLKHKLDLINIESKLHSAFINGKEMHRLLKININSEAFLLDVGLGWPLIYPLSLKNEININCFGLFFKTKIKENVFELYKFNNNNYTLSYSASIFDIDSGKIKSQINKRFVNTEQYPFSNSIRFSKIVNNEFYFLKDNILGYSYKNTFYNKKITNLKEYIFLFKSVFNFDVDIATKVANKLNMFYND